MNTRGQGSPNFIYPVGTQIVALKHVQGSNGDVIHPAGAVGVVIRSPRDRQHSYRIRFPDGLASSWSALANAHLSAAEIGAMAASS